MKKYILVILFLLFAYQIEAQTSDDDFALTKAKDCELNNLHLDMIIINAVKNNEQVFVISYAGKNEKSGVNRARLLYTKTVMSNFKGLSSNKITIATGERLKENQGKVEIWLGSKLFLVMLPSKNQQVCLQVSDFQPT